jgi:hypothetical protein
MMAEITKENINHLNGLCLLLKTKSVKKRPTVISDERNRETTTIAP